MEFHNAPVSLFEVSWEVCNKVGGIYSVVSSKALQAVETFGEDYFLLGPMLQHNAGFEETDEHIWDSVRSALAARNLKCSLGRWNIPGRPKAILVNFDQRYGSNQLLYELWKSFGVDSLSGGWDYVEPVMFATACGEVSGQSTRPSTNASSSPRAAAPWPSSMNGCAARACSA